MKRGVLAFILAVGVSAVCYAQAPNETVKNESSQEGVPEQYQWIFGEKGKELRDAQQAEMKEKAAKPAGVLAKPAVSPFKESSENVWDFGQVRAGDVVRHDFIIKNTKSKVLNIKEVHTSCGCTVSEVPKKVLQPGEDAPIQVKMDTKGDSGPVKQHIYVNTDDPENPVYVFVIKAEVK